MARVKRAVNAQKKRRVDPRARQRLPRPAFAAVPQGQGAGSALADLRLQRPAQAQERLPQALDHPDQRGRACPRHDLQPVHAGPEGRRRRGRPQGARRAGRVRRGRLRRAGRRRPGGRSVGGRRQPPPPTPRTRPEPAARPSSTPGRTFVGRAFCCQRCPADRRVARTRPCSPSGPPRIVAAHRLLRRSRRTEAGEFLAEGAPAVTEAIALRQGPSGRGARAVRHRGRRCQARRRWSGPRSPPGSRSPR